MAGEQFLRFLETNSTLRIFFEAFSLVEIEAHCRYDCYTAPGNDSPVPVRPSIPKLLSRGTECCQALGAWGRKMPASTKAQKSSPTIRQMTWPIDQW